MDTFKKRLAKAMRRMNITQAELCAMTGISRSTMSQYYSGAFRPKEDKLRRIAKALEVNEAWLLGYENPNSTAELVEKFPNIRPVHLKQFPILGEIACGKPIFAEEERGSFLMASDEIHADFCLLAHGDSMTGARIYDGDAVFIRSQPMVENGEIAAVIINDEAQKAGTASAGGRKSGVPASGVRRRGIRNCAHSRQGNRLYESAVIIHENTKKRRGFLGKSSPFSFAANQSSGLIVRRMAYHSRLLRRRLQSCNVTR